MLGGGIPAHILISEGHRSQWLVRNTSLISLDVEKLDPKTAGPYRQRESGCSGSVTSPKITVLICPDTHNLFLSIHQLLKLWFSNGILPSDAFTVHNICNTG